MDARGDRFRAEACLVLPSLLASGERRHEISMGWQRESVLLIGPEYLMARCPDDVERVPVVEAHGVSQDADELQQLPTIRLVVVKGS